MKKAEVLKLNKKSNKKDEGVLYMENIARTKSMVLTIIIILVVAVYNVFARESVFDILSILFAYIGIEGLFKYNFLKKKSILFTGIAFITAAICFLVVHIIA